MQKIIPATIYLPLTVYTFHSTHPGYGRVLSSLSIAVILQGERHRLVLIYGCMSGFTRKASILSDVCFPSAAHEIQFPAAPWPPAQLSPELSTEELPPRASLEEVSSICLFNAKTLCRSSCYGPLRAFSSCRKREESFCMTPDSLCSGNC